MQYLSSIIVSFILTCSGPLSAAKTDTDHTGSMAVGGYADSHLDCAGS